MARASCTRSILSVVRRAPQVFRSLGPGGRLLLYGTLSGEPIQVDPRLVISGPRVIEGFWLGHWMRQRSIPKALLLFREIAALIRLGVLRSEIGQDLPTCRDQGGRPTRRDHRAARKGSAQNELILRLLSVRHSVFVEGQALLVPEAAVEVVHQRGRRNGVHAAAPAGLGPNPGAPARVASRRRTA